MRAVEQVEVAAGSGIVDDRYFGSRHRHVSVQSTADLVEAEQVSGLEIAAGDTRRNVTVSGGPLPTDPGSRLRIGEVELEVVRIAAPCRVMDETIAPGARAALRRRGGVICRALSDGPIAIDDVAVAEEGQAASGTVAAKR